MEGTSAVLASLPGALAILGAFGSDAMGPVMISQCLDPQSYRAITWLSQILDGASQPMVGPTFKLGAMVSVHAACVFVGRISAWDGCGTFIPLRDDQAVCYSTEDGFMRQMGSCVYTGVKDHASAVVHGLKLGKVIHHYIKLSVTPNLTDQSKSWPSARIVGASWPLVVAIVLFVLKEWLWAIVVLVGWTGWFLLCLSAGSVDPQTHRCGSNCSQRQRRYLLNDQRVTKCLIDYTVCKAFDDEVRRAMPKRRTRWILLRLLGGILLAAHFPIGLVATCYNDSAGALIWVLMQFLGLLAGLRWWCREHRLVRHGIGYSGAVTIVTTEIKSSEKWGGVLDRVEKCHWKDIKHKYA